MKNHTSKLPLFMQDPKVDKIIREIISCIPKETKVFLVGGATRNALYYKYFKKKLPQRDYDLVIIGNSKKFISNLKKKKFLKGNIQKKDEVTLKKPKIENPKKISDYVVLDIHISKEKNIKKLTKKEANFTFNCSVLPLKEATSKNWDKKIVSSKNSLKDLKNKQIKINSLNHPANLFACIRFMSKGFKKPSEKEIGMLLDSLKNLPKEKFERNVKKVFDYVGGEKARLLVKKLGIKEDIFSEKIFNKS